MGLPELKPIDHTIKYPVAGEFIDSLLITVRAKDCPENIRELVFDMIQHAQDQLQIWAEYDGNLKE